MHKTMPLRFWEKVDQQGPDECWPWIAILDRRGYGRFHLMVDGKRRTTHAHRVAYQLLIGPIPEGLTLDHLCRNPRCVNPAHLQPVTHRENCRRGIAGQVNATRLRAKTHCANGHLLDEANTYWRPSRGRDGRPYRDCRACRRNRERIFYQKKVTTRA